MGDRYILTQICPKCKYFCDDVYYAPTCGINTWTCPKCKTIVDLEKETGITKEDASNIDIIKNICKIEINKNE